MSLLFSRSPWLKISSLLVFGFLLWVSSAFPAYAQNMNDAGLAVREEVIAVETAFAKTMATRDFKAFAEFIAEDAVFFNGKKVLRGKRAILAEWEHFFADKVAPFSWKPEELEALLSASLASSSGPVYDAKGQPIARFVSIWRKDGQRWQIVFDRGIDICLCKKE